MSLEAGSSRMVINVNQEMIDKFGEFKDGVGALNALLDASELVETQEAALGRILATASDEWPFYMRQRMGKNLNETQWERLIHLCETQGLRIQPTPLWFCELIADMAGHARSPVEANQWKKPAKRLLKALGYDTDVRANWEK